jgi:hypothetical protein
MYKKKAGVSKAADTMTAYIMIMTAYSIVLPLQVSTMPLVYDHYDVHY